MTTTITIKDKAVNTTYQNVTGLTGGSGVDAVFDVTKTNGTYSVVLDSLAASAGTGYVAGDTITLAGTALGGTVSNNLIVTVATVGAAGKIATFGVVGTGRVGDGTVDVAVDVTGTAGIDTYTFGGASTEFTVVQVMFMHCWRPHWAQQMSLMRTLVLASILLTQVGPTSNWPKHCWPQTFTKRMLAV